MKYIKTYKIFEDLNSNLDIFDIEFYTINTDGTIDVNDDVRLDEMELVEIPFKFNEVTGNFNCSINDLITLSGSPIKVGKDFSCASNNLSNLADFPIEIGYSIYCSDNKLTSLEGCPIEVGGYFYCDHNQLESLEYCPSEIGGDLGCEHNRLTLLDCSSYVKGDIYCYGMFEQEPEFFGDCEGKIYW